MIKTPAASSCWSREEKMRKQVVLASFIASLCATPCTAQGPTDIIATRFTQDGGYIIKLGPVVAVFEEPPQGFPTRKDKDIFDPEKDVWVLAYPNVPQGARVCALSLGENWPGEGRDPANIKLEKALGCGAVDDQGNVEIAFPVTQQQPYAMGVSWAADVDTQGGDGEADAWGSHPGYYRDPQGGSPFHGEWLIKTLEGRPMTGWKVDPVNKKISPLPEASKKALEERFSG